MPWGHSHLHALTRFSAHWPWAGTKGARTPAWSDVHPHLADRDALCVVLSKPPEPSRQLKLKPRMPTRTSLAHILRKIMLIFTIPKIVPLPPTPHIRQNTLLKMISEQFRRRAAAEFFES